MCITNASTMMDTDEDDKFEAQVAKYNVHFKALMGLIPISQHDEDLDSDEEVNGYEESGGKGKKLKKAKNSNPPGGKYGSKMSKKLKNQYQHGMSLADALKTKRQARKHSKSKGKQQDKGKQGKFKGKPDKFKGKHRPGKKD